MCFQDFQYLKQKLIFFLLQQGPHCDSSLSWKANTGRWKAGRVERREHCEKDAAQSLHDSVSLDILPSEGLLSQISLRANSSRPEQPKETASWEKKVLRECLFNC